MPSPISTRTRFLLAILAAVITIYAFLAQVDQAAANHTEGALERALVTFAVARALNGVVSVLQGTELAVQPAGVGLTLAPGEIVDPLNDLVEQFSWVMLAASSSLGVQRIFLEMSGWWPWQILVAASAIALIVVLLFFPNAHRSRRFAAGLLGFALLLRFAVPLMVVLNDGVYQVFLADQYEEANAVVETTSRELERLQAEVAESEGSRASGNWIEGISRWIEQRRASLDLESRMQAIADKATVAIEHLLELIAIFAVQTVLLPLLFLFLLVRASRLFVRLAH